MEMQSVIWGGPGTLSNDLVKQYFSSFSPVSVSFFTTLLYTS